ncbi:MAG TPA: alpha/beta fold hydrolase [Gemmatimonadaceae bacterium]
MRLSFHRLAVVSVLSLGMRMTVAAQSSAAPKMARFDRCPLEQGGAIESCEVAYRSYGTLTPTRDNVIVFTTWFLGRTDGLLGFYVGGPEQLVDTTRYYVVTIDAFGNGQSSSPSTSGSQHGARFPRFTVRDLVESQHRLLHDVLGLPHVRAVMGTSMGGMQAVQWSVQYPDFMDKIVAVVPTPRTAVYDRVLWGTELRAIETAASNTPPDSLLALLEGLHALALQTPGYVNRTAAGGANELVMQRVAEMRERFDPWDWASQLRAMLSHDVGAPFGGSLERAGAQVRARTLLIVATQDHMVTPASIFDWARWTHADLLELREECGHMAPGCERERVQPAVMAFLAR